MRRKLREIHEWWKHGRNTDPAYYDIAWSLGGEFGVLREMAFEKFLGWVWSLKGKK